MQMHIYMNKGAARRGGTCGVWSLWCDGADVRGGALGSVGADGGHWGVGVNTCDDIAVPALSSLAS